MTPPASEDPRLQAGAQLLADLRAEIARADTKATVLVGALGIAAGGMSTLLTNRRWAPGALGPMASLLRWSAAVMLVTALTNTGHDPAHCLLFSPAETSRIATRKHFWIRAGVTAFAGAAVLLTGPLLLA